MTMDDLEIVGEYREEFNTILGINIPCGPIYRSRGLATHVNDHHPDCMMYYPMIPDVIASPDYIGKDPTKPGSIELIKKVNEYLLVAITLNPKENYLYVSTLFDQTESKVKMRLNSGRYKKI